MKKVDEFNIETNISLKNNAELTCGINVSSTNNVTTTEIDSRQNNPNSKLVIIVSRDKDTNKYKSRFKSSAFNEKKMKKKKSEKKMKKKTSARKEFIQITYDDGIGDNKNYESEQLINENDPMSISNGRLCGIKSKPECTKNVYSNHSFNDKIQTCDIKKMIENESKNILYGNDKKSMENSGQFSIKLEPVDTKNVYSHIDSRIGMIKVRDIRTMIDDKLSIEMYNKIFSENLFDIKKLPRIFDAVEIQDL